MTEACEKMVLQTIIVEPMDKCKGLEKNQVSQDITMEEEESLEREFATGTTAHGFSRAAETKSIFRRSAWILLILGGLGMATWMISLRVINYFQYDTSTEITLTFEPRMAFPAVTICNFNRYMRRNLNAEDYAIISLTEDVYSGYDSGYSYGQYYYNYYYDYSGDGESSPSTTTQPTNSNFNESWANISASYPNGFDFGNFTLEKGWKLDNISVLECTFKGIKCNLKKDFIHTFSTYGNCYTYNPSLNSNRSRYQDQPGLGNGLHLTIDVEQSEYTESLPDGSAQTGVIFQVHPQWEPPLVESKGLGASPGFHAFGALKRQETVNIEPPWGKCNKSLTLLHFDQYTFSGCIIECKLQKIETECGCKPVQYPGTYRICDPAEMMYCVKPLLKTINQAFSDHCHMCTVPCNSTQYNVQLSYTTIPNNNIESAFATKYNLPTGSNYIKDNIVALDIYYEELNLETMEQKKAVEESGLLSDIGGQLGLFMGFSALTFLEFFEYIILKFRRITQRKKRIKPLA